MEGGWGGGGLGVIWKAFGAGVPLQGLRIGTFIQLLRKNCIEILDWFYTVVMVRNVYLLPDHVHCYIFAILRLGSRGIL